MEMRLRRYVAIGDALGCSARVEKGRERMECLWEAIVVNDWEGRVGLCGSGSLSMDWALSPRDLAFDIEKTELDAQSEHYQIWFALTCMMTSKAVASLPT